MTDARLQSTREIEFRDAHTHKLNMTTEEFLAAEYQMRLLNNEDQEIIYRMLVLNQIVKFVNGIPPALMFYGGVNEACKNHENYRIFFDKFTLAMNARTPMYK